MYAVTFLSHSKDFTVARSLDESTLAGLDESTESTLAREFISLAWRKSSRSIGNGQCVEAAQLPDGRLAMRDSTDKSGPAIVVGQEAWRLFVRTVRQRTVRQGDPGTV